MPHQAMTDHDLARTGRKQAFTGSRLLIGGAILFVLGLVLALVGHDVVRFFGIMFMALSAPPLMGGGALVASGLVSRRHSQHKPFA